MTEALWIALVSGGFTLMGRWLDSLGQGKKIRETLDKMSERLIVVENTVNKNSRGIQRVERYILQKPMGQALSRGYVSQQELTEVSSLYESYHELGGNGAIEAMYAKFKELPIKEEY